MLLSLVANAQLSSKERADSVREANRVRLDSIRAMNAHRTDSIKQRMQYRKDSIAVVKQLKLDQEREAKQKSKRKRNEEEEIVGMKNESSKDSIAEAKKVAIEKRKQENIAKRNSRFKKRPKQEPPISQEFLFGYRLATDGWTFFSHRGFIKTDDPEKVHTMYLYSELSEKKSPKERLTQNESFIATNPDEIKPVAYKYGKINNFYALKLGVGNVKPLTGTLDRKSMVISWNYQAGLSIGMLKPYYLDLLVRDGGAFVRKIDKYSDNTKESFLDSKNQGTIIGGSDFTKGLNEIKIQPGLSLRSGFNFDYSFSKYSFLAVEIGTSLELYTKQIPIMINTSNRAAFVNVYVDARFGKRWKKKSAVREMKEE
jgi:hypothetical protein